MALNPFIYSSDITRQAANERVICKRARRNKKNDGDDLISEANQLQHCFVRQFQQQKNVQFTAIFIWIQFHCDEICFSFSLEIIFFPKKTNSTTLKLRWQRWETTRLIVSAMKIVCFNLSFQILTMKMQKYTESISAPWVFFLFNLNWSEKFFETITTISIYVLNIDFAIDNCTFHMVGTCESHR